MFKVALIPPGSVRMKEWLATEAMRLGVNAGHLRTLLKTKPETIRVRRDCVYVLPGQHAQVESRKPIGNEQPFKVWCAEEADRLGISVQAVKARFSAARRHKYVLPKRRIASARTIFVQPYEPVDQDYAMTISLARSLDGE